MLPRKLTNAAASMVTISTTALDIEGLIGADLPTDIDAIDIFIETNSIRWLDDGNTPTSSNGHLASSTGINTIQLRGTSVRKFQMIRAGSADATGSIRIGYNIIR